MTLIDSKRIQPGYEPIEGYVLEKKIGRGGYGEVWRAEAPGGLKKAVKFVFGQHDEHRAKQEIKSLERIKTVRHPFILTLERFEFIDNQLVIVTELAEASLQEIYDQHRERGSCGIPRNSLLGYMRDVADALDYLHQLYKFQHLDIKPGNLLMVGGRVKVADFGLLKDLGDVDCSLVGGLTPLYAPPELFDGCPSVHSDQYSLAVMYQELLTGTRPFRGRTIAQLATQHVHNAPDLTPLPGCDRPSVARALEKNPDRRFDSCTEFVDKLFDPHSGSDRNVRSNTESATKPSARKVENLPQLQDVDQSKSQQAEVLVIALGGTGADGLHQLRGRVAEFGSSSPVTLHSVLIDTDALSTQSLAMMDTVENGPGRRTVLAELRTSNQYRETGTEKFRSISRRWIYNVPRNATTGGMRPLGRLAMVDHGAKIREALTDAIKDFKVNVNADDRPRVYVLASLAGGTGSGMYLDVVHLLRYLLDEAALENATIVSLLTANRFQGDPKRPLALHTTKSALQELSHFMKPGNGYPGDEGAQWPSLPAARSPLNRAYLVAPSTSPGSPSAIDSAVNYVWADATVCGKWFEEGRLEGIAESSTTVGLRSVAVVPIGDPQTGRASLLAPYAAKALLLWWLGNPKDADRESQDLFLRIKRRCYLDGDALRRKAEEWIGSTEQVRRMRLTEFLSTLDPAILRSDATLRPQLMTWLTEAIELDRSEVLVEQFLGHIRNEITVRLQDARLNLSSTMVGLTLIQDHIKEVARAILAKSDLDFQRLETQGAEIKPRTVDGSVGGTALEHPRDSRLSNAIQLGENLMQVISARVAAAIATSLESQLADLKEVYSNASVTVAQTVRVLGENLNDSFDPWDSVEESLKESLPSLLDHVHQKCFSSHFKHLIQTPTEVSHEALAGELTTELTNVIRKAGQQDSFGSVVVEPGAETNRLSHDANTSDIKSDDTLGVQDSVSDVSSDGSTTSVRLPSESHRMTQTQSWGDQKPASVMSIEAAIEAVRPPLLDCGGKQRFYLLCRDNHEKSTVLAKFPEGLRESVSVILEKTATPMLVQEGQQTDVDAVLAWLDSLTGDDGKISGRLMTRCDVQWEEQPIKRL